jgi:hypothetical protein
MAEINDILVVLSDLAKRNYFIPSYQRGYRWEKQQVTELLDDIWDFAETKQDQDYYCLQPIVVRKMSNDMVVQYELSSETGGDWYEVEEIPSGILDVHHRRSVAAHRHGRASAEKGACQDYCKALHFITPESWTSL